MKRNFHCQRIDWACNPINTATTLSRLLLLYLRENIIERMFYLEEKTITIACPVRNRATYLLHYLDHLYSLNYNKKLISFYFLINNSTDGSEKILLDFKSKHEDKYNKITLEHFQKKHYKPDDARTDDARKNFSYKHLSNLRNKILQSTETDYLFSVDTDIMVPSDTLNKLLSANVDACAGLIFNGYIQYPNEYWKYPNILKINRFGGFEHISNWYVKNAPTLTESKLIPVDGTGAIILLSNKICKDTKYSYHDQGEDLGWSLDCKTKGYQLYCEVSAFAYHCMNEQLLQQYIESKKMFLS
jgi:cellulose synthase/poly-beta-1,6-N-acetylglucosamine synthase-like glycosyltransferase